MKIQQAGVEDFPELLTIWESAVRETHHFLTEEDILFFKPLLLNDYFKAVALFCIRAQGRMEGFIGLSADQVEMLFVRPDAFGKGIGKQLMHFAISEKGISRVDVNEQNEQAVGFYRHLGFTAESRSALDSAGKPFPILHMRLG